MSESFDVTRGHGISVCPGWSVSRPALGRREVRSVPPGVARSQGARASAPGGFLSNNNKDHRGALSEEAEAAEAARALGQGRERPGARCPVLDPAGRRPLTPDGAALRCAAGNTCLFWSPGRCGAAPGTQAVFSRPQGVCHVFRAFYSRERKTEHWEK